MEEKITAWVARDEDRELYLYAHKPHKITNAQMWYSGTIYSDIIIPDSLFPQVKWEDDEPTKVELTIKICK